MKTIQIPARITFLHHPSQQTVTVSFLEVVTQIVDTSPVFARGPSMWVKGSKIIAAAENATDQLYLEDDHYSHLRQAVETFEAGKGFGRHLLPFADAILNATDATPEDSKDAKDPLTGKP